MLGNNPIVGRTVLLKHVGQPNNLKYFYVYNMKYCVVSLSYPLTCDKRIRGHKTINFFVNNIDKTTWKMFWMW